MAESKRFLVGTLVSTLVSRRTGHIWAGERGSFGSGWIMVITSNERIDGQ